MSVLVNEITSSVENLVIESADHQIIVETPTPPTTNIVTEGLQGPPGRDGENVIGGYSVELANVSPGDLLTFGVGNITNVKRTQITDGGNF